MRPIGASAIKWNEVVDMIDVSQRFVAPKTEFALLLILIYQIAVCIRSFGLLLSCPPIAAFYFIFQSYRWAISIVLAMFFVVALSVLYSVHPSITPISFQDSVTIHRIPGALISSQLIAKQSSSLVLVIKRLFSMCPVPSSSISTAFFFVLAIAFTISKDFWALFAALSLFLSFFIGMSLIARPAAGVVAMFTNMFKVSGVAFDEILISEWIRGATNAAIACIQLAPRNAISHGECGQRGTSAAFSGINLDHFRIIPLMGAKS